MANSLPIALQFGTVLYFTELLDWVKFYGPTPCISYSSMALPIPRYFHIKVGIRHYMGEPLRQFRTDRSKTW